MSSSDWLLDNMPMLTLPGRLRASAIASLKVRYDRSGWQVITSGARPNSMTLKRSESL